MSSPLNILFIIDCLAYGGTEKQLIELINQLNKDKFIPHLCCLKTYNNRSFHNKESDELFKKININKIILDYKSLKTIKYWFSLVELIKYIKMNNIEIIQTYFQDSTLFGLLAGKICRVRNITANFRDLAFWVDSKGQHYKNKITFQFCSNYIANSNAVKEKYIRLFNLSAKKFSVIYNGIDISKYSNLSNRKSYNQKNITVAIVSNLNRKVKRIDVFIKAAANVIKINNNINFKIIGDGEFKKDLILLCNNLFIQDKVKFLGLVKDIPLCLSSIDIGINSSDSEGFSNSILEYMAAGVVIVATNVGGNSEVIINGKNGFLVDAGDFNKMVDIIQILATNQDVYKKVQYNAYKSVFDNYSIDKFVKVYENYYSTL